MRKYFPKKVTVFNDHDDSDDEDDPDLLMTLSSELGPVSYVTVAGGLGH